MPVLAPSGSCLKLQKKAREVIRWIAAGLSAVLALSASAVAGQGAGLTRASRAALNLGPSWSRHGLAASWGTGWTDNCSFLTNTRASEITDSDFAMLDPEGLVDPGRMKKLQIRYEALSRDYETRKSYQLMGYSEEQSTARSFGDLGHNFLDEMGKYQGEKGSKILFEMGRRVPVLQTLSGPLAILTASYFLFYREKPLEIDVSDVTRVSIRFSRMLSAANPDKDVYSLGLTRKIPFWDLSTGLSYGGGTNVMAASLNKQLTRSLVWKVDARTPLNPVTSPVKSPEETTQLEYKLSF